LKLGQENQTDFRFDGVILAGGFVRYSMRFNLAVARLFMAVAPWWVWRMLFRVYLAYGGFRHRHAQEKGGRGNSACDFIERRTPSDMAAMRARLGLIAGSDPRAVVRKVTCPIYQLAGFIDPVVPPAAVTRWLNRNSPSFKGHRIIWPADHNVLGTEPAKALAEIEQWIFRSACLERGDRGT
jgi:pimeloyl-ACP methyl ester carboxylesterase